MIVSTAQQTDREHLLHQVPVEGVRVVEVEHAALRPGDLLLTELPVEGVLGQGHHLQHPGSRMLDRDGNEPSRRLKFYSHKEWKMKKDGWVS